MADLENILRCTRVDDHHVICEGLEYASEALDVAGSSQFYFHLFLALFWYAVCGYAANWALAIQYRGRFVLYTIYKQPGSSKVCTGSCSALLQILVSWALSTLRDHPLVQ